MESRIKTGNELIAQEFGLDIVTSDEIVHLDKADSEFVKIYTWSEFKTQAFEEPKWIVEGLVPEKGLVAVASSPESCKSYFADYLASTVAQGGVLFNLYPTTSVPVLLIDQENLAPWLQKRISNFITEENVPLYIYSKQESLFSVKDEEVFNEVLRYIEKKQIGLVIIDTLRLIHNKEENSSTEMKFVFDRLRQLTEKAAVIFIHHHKKADKFGRGKVNGEDMMGSIFIRGCVDSQFTLTKLTKERFATDDLKIKRDIFLGLGSHLTLKDKIVGFDAPEYIYTLKKMKEKEPIIAERVAPENQPEYTHQMETYFASNPTLLRGRESHPA